MDIGSLTDLEQGVKYLFQYKPLAPQRVPREGMAVYIGRDVMNNGTFKLIFSGRPEFGTMTMNSEQLTYIYPAKNQSAPCFFDRKITPRSRR